MRWGVLTDEQWAALESLSPKNTKVGRPPVRPRRQLIDGHTVPGPDRPTTASVMRSSAGSTASGGTALPPRGMTSSRSATSQFSCPATSWACLIPTDPEGHRPALAGEGWREWIEVRYDVFDLAWSWTRISLHHHVDDQGVFEVLPSLFRQFLAELAARGVEELKKRHRKQFSDRWPTPEHTHTVDPR